MSLRDDEIASSTHSQVWGEARTRTAESGSQPNLTPRQPQHGVSDANLEQATGLEPAFFGLKGRPPTLDDACLVEDRGNAPRMQSPCKGNQLTLEHPPNWYRASDEPRLY